MSLAVELARLEPDELAYASQRTNVDDPGWLYETVDRYQVLQDVNYIVGNYYGLLPPHSDRSMAMAAAYVMSLGLIHAADAQREAALLLHEIVGESKAPGLQEALIMLTAQDIEDGADAVFDHPLWRADQAELAEFFAWYPSLHGLILGSAKKMVVQGRTIRERCSYINGGLAAAQILVEAGEAQTARG